MEQKEKQVLVTMITMILIFVFYSLHVYNRYIIPDPEILNDFQFWGKAFIILIPVVIIVQIVIHIVYAIINRIVTREDLQDKDDERDKLIELKSIRVSHWIFTLGFLVAMGVLAMGMKPWVMFLVLVASGFISGIVSEAVKIFYYRKGI